MDQKVIQKLYITPDGSLKFSMSTMDFHIGGLREDMFGQVCFHLTYYKN